MHFKVNKKNIKVNVNGLHWALTVASVALYEWSYSLDTSCITFAQLASVFSVRKSNVMQQIFVLFCKQNNCTRYQN